MSETRDQPSLKKDESLNLTSEKMDPLKCLYSKNVQVPNEKAPLLDNLTKFNVNENSEVSVKTTVVKPKPTESTVYERADIRATLVDKKVKTKKNVLSKLEKINKGPLLALKNCMIQKIPVKVITRNHSSKYSYFTFILSLLYTATMHNLQPVGPFYFQFFFFFFILHNKLGCRENLCAKCISMDHIMKAVVKVINYVCSRGIIHRQFQEFLVELNSEFEDVGYYLQVSWLCIEKMLKRVYDLHKEILLFTYERLL